MCELRPFYEALGKQRDIPPRAAAISDFLKRSSLTTLNLSKYAGVAGDRIYLMATDNGRVVSATVEMIDGDRSVFENGTAVEVDASTGYWMYIAPKCAGGNGLCCNGSDPARLLPENGS